MDKDQAQKIIELLQKLNENVEGLAMEVATHVQWQREMAQWPRAVTVQERTR